MKNRQIITKGLLLIVALCVNMVAQAEEYFTLNETRTFSNDEIYDVSLNGDPGILTYSMTEGGTYNSACKSTFKVSTSINGTDFTELASYTRFDTSATFYLNPDVRYIRFNFDKCWASNYKSNLKFSITKALSANPISLNLGDIFVGNSPTTKSFALHYSNGAATATTYNLTCANPHVTFSPTSVSANAKSNGTQIITVGYSEDAPATGITNATIVATNTKRTTQKASVDISINIKKHTQTITWQDTIDVVSVGDELTNAALASTNLPLTYSSNNPSVIQIIDGNLVAVSTGTATITATQVGNGMWHSVNSTKVIEVTEKNIQRIIWNDNLSRLRVGDVMTLSAYAIDKITGLSNELPITYNVSPTGIASLNGNQLTATTAGKVIITAYQAGNNSYAPVSYQLNAHVLPVSGQVCNPLVLDAGENHFSTISNREYTLSGEPGYLTFDAKSIAILGVLGGDLKIAQWVDNKWIDVFSQLPPKDNYKSYGPIQLDRKATKLMFYTVLGATGEKYFRDIKVTLANYLEVNKSTIHFDIEADVKSSNSFTVKYSNIDDVLMVDHSSNTFNFSPTLSTIGTGCGDKGTQTFEVSFNTLIGGNYKDVVTISDGNLSTAVTITANVAKHKQSINWNQDINITYEESPLTLTATATSGLPVTYTSSDESIAQITDGKLIVVKTGDVTITASQSGNGIYKAATDVVKEITVIKRVNITNPVIAISCPTYNDSVRSDEGKFVSITCSDAVPHTIYYTLDSSTPTSESFLYQNAFEINGTTTIKTIAIPTNLTLYNESEIVSKTYTVFDCNNYTITHFSNTSNTATTVNWSGDLIGASTLSYWIGTEESNAEIVTIITSENSFTVTDLQASTQYYFQLTDKYGCTSNVSSVTTTAIVISPIELFSTQIDASVTQLISIFGEEITGDITLSLTNNTDNYFSMNKSAVSSTGGDVAITYSPKVVGTHTATFTLSSTSGNTAITLTLTGNAFVKTISAPEIVTNQSFIIKKEGFTGSLSVYNEKKQLIPTDITETPRQYKVSFQRPEVLEELACKNITMELKNGEGVIQTEMVYKVPIIISKDTITSQIALDFDSCSTCDVVVLNSATLSKGSDNKSFRDVYVSTGANIEIPANKELNVRNFYLRSHNDSISTTNLTNKDGKITSSQGFAHLKRISDQGRYLFFSLPYSCAIKDVKLSDGKSIGTYGSNWNVKEYDGLQRGTINPKGSNWKSLNFNDSLIAGKGYIIATDSDCELIFPSYMKSTEQLEKNSYVVTAYGIEPQYDAIKPNNKGWNLVGLPFLNSANGDANETELVVNTSKINYITTQNSDGKTYTQKKVSDQKLEPFRCYFIQANRTGELNFITESSVKAPQKAVASRAKNELKLVAFGKSGSDETEIILDDSQTSDYSIGNDLGKMYAAADIPQLYSKTNGYQLAFNALPLSEAYYIPLGFYAPLADNYTISAINKTDYSVYLLDNTTGITTNLAQTSYSFQAKKGLTETRFSISIEQRIATAVEQTTGAEEPQAFMRPDGTLTLQNIGVGAVIQISDAIGRIIYNATATNETLSLTLNTQGVYHIQIAHKGETQLLRTIY